MLINSFSEFKKKRRQYTALGHPYCLKLFLRHDQAVLLNLAYTRATITCIITETSKVYLINLPVEIRYGAAMACGSGGQLSQKSCPMRTWVHAPAVLPDPSMACRSEGRDGRQSVSVPELWREGRWHCLKKVCATFRPRGTRVRRCFLGQLLIGLLKLIGYNWPPN